jgi:ADP-heptose:LPS heptosyltransferase
VKKVLIIRFSSIGDIVLTTPVIRCVHKQLGAEVHVLTKKAFAGLLEANPYVHHIHTMDKSLREVLPHLRAHRFDFIIDLHKNLRSFKLRLGLGRPLYTFDKLNWEKWLLTSLHIDRLPRIHIVDRYFKALEPLGVVNDLEGLDYFIPPNAEINPESWLTPGDAPYVVAVLGAAHATKQIPVHQLIAILQTVNHPVLLLGGPADKETGERVMAGRFSHPVINLAGKLSIHESASVIRQSAAVLTPDTGMMHIAAAFRKPIISVWGNTVPAFGMYPYLPPGSPEGNIWEVQGLACRPCSKIGSANCPKGHFRCMLDQDPQDIGDSIDACCKNK